MRNRVKGTIYASRFIFRQLSIFQRGLILLPSLEETVKRELLKVTDNDKEEARPFFEPEIALYYLEVTKELLEQTISAVVVLTDLAKGFKSITDIGAIEQVASKIVRDANIHEGVVHALQNPEGFLAILDDQRNRLESKLRAYSNVATMVVEEGGQLAKSAIEDLNVRLLPDCEELKTKWEYWKTSSYFPPEIQAYLYEQICNRCHDIAAELGLTCIGEIPGEKHAMWWYIFMAAFIIYDIYK